MTASICKHGAVLLFVARKMSGGLGAKWDAHGQDKTCGRVGNSAPSPKEDAWSTAVVQINADGQILSGVSSSIPLLGLGVCREHLQGSNGRSGPSALGDYWNLYESIATGTDPPQFFGYSEDLSWSVMPEQSTQRTDPATQRLPLVPKVYQHLWCLRNFCHLIFFSAHLWSHFHTIIEWFGASPPLL